MELELIKDMNNLTYEEFYNKNKPIFLIKYKTFDKISTFENTRNKLILTEVENNEIIKLYKTNLIIDDSNKLDLKIALYDIMNNIKKDEEFIEYIYIHEKKRDIDKKLFNDLKSEDKLNEIFTNDSLYMTRWNDIFNLHKITVKKYFMNDINILYNYLKKLYFDKLVAKREYKEDLSSFNYVLKEYNDLYIKLNNVYHKDKAMELYIMDFIRNSNYGLDELIGCTEYINKLKSIYDKRN